MRTCRELLVATCLMVGNASQAQDGALDPTFNAVTGIGNGDGADSHIYTATLQPDGKIIIGGLFTTYHGMSVGKIARVNVDGSSDGTFQPGAGTNTEVRATAVQSDGKVLLGGNFTTFNGTSCNRLARLNADGTLDAGFAIGTGANTYVYSIAVQTDNKVLIAGAFSNYNGVVRRQITRLNADGSADASFSSGTGATQPIRALALLPDGKIIIGGEFTSYNGTARNYIARLNADGSLDTGFNPGIGANGVVFCVMAQPDGKVLIGGSFTSFNGTARNRIARLNTDGSLDTGFDPGTGASSHIMTIARQTDGRAIIGGNFTTYNGTGRTRVARLNTDGSLDATFDPGAGANDWVYALPMQPDGSIILAGAFTQYAGQDHKRLARLGTSGAIDPVFGLGYGANDEINDIALQPDGKIIIGGNFTRYNGTVRWRVARLNTDGTLDPSLDPGLGPNHYVYNTVIQPDGKILVSGYFNQYNGASVNRIVRLDPTGSLDPGFSPFSASSGAIYATEVQADGKILVGGDINDGNSYKLVRMNPDGSDDPGMVPGAYGGLVLSTAVQGDGKVLVGGSFQNYNGTSRNRIARLNADGTVDTSFDPGSGANTLSVFVVQLQPDGKILIGGSFTAYNGTNRNRIARLNTDGSLDASFDPGTGCDGSVASIALQPDGRIIIVGAFNNYNGTGRRKLARLNANGSLDTSFDPGTGTNNTIARLVLQPDGKILIGGDFSTYNGVNRDRIARLMGTARSGIRVLLEGPFSGGSMGDALRILPSYPLTEPFTAMGYSEAAYTPGASIAPGVLSVIGNNAIVDWVIVEMRPAATPNVVAASRAVLLQRDGDVVDLDGGSSVGFSGLAHGNYSVVVKPRNHLPVMLSPSTPFAYGTSTTTVDFTLSATQVYDNDARKNVGGVMLLQAGDVSFNEELKYVGAGNDRDPILLRVGGSTPTATVSGYYPEDVNMDGIVKYVGAANDRDPILLNIGGSTPTAVRNAQLP